MRKCLVTYFAVAVFLLVTLPLGAQTSKADADRIAKLEQQIADAKSSADNSWMLTSSALVLMMTGPGLALFYGGLVRKKNVLATMMQSLDRKSTRLNSSHVEISYAVFCLKK